MNEVSSMAQQLSSAASQEMTASRRTGPQGVRQALANARELARWQQVQHEAFAIINKRVTESCRNEDAGRRQ